MNTTIKVRRIGAGHYEIHTPHGTFLLDNCPADSAQIEAGFRSGPRWMLTYPGQYSADAAFGTKRDGIQQIKDVLAWELKNTTPEQLATSRRNYHADNSPWAKVAERQSAPAIEDAQDTKETDTVAKTPDLRVLANRKTADPETVAEIHANRCPECKGAGCPQCGYKGTRRGCRHHAVADGRGTHAETLPVPTCQSGTTYGVWDELAGGFTFAVDCAMEAANWAAEQLDDDPDGEMSILAVCREHEEQPADNCEDCCSEDA